MGKVINSTDILDSNMYLKSRVPKNKSPNNYYLKSLQQKIDYEWKYRSNVIDIEEETAFGSENFTPIEAVIQKVYDPQIKTELSDDWKNLVFKDMFHNSALGRRYRFSLTFDPECPNEDKCVWLTVNHNAESATSSVVVRRCNSLLTFVSNLGTVHYEPAILEDTTKNINFYRDETIALAQGEVEVFMQYNEYTKHVKIGDRFFVGETDEVIEQNNWIYRVKLVRKYQSDKTYKVGSVPLIKLVLDKDDLGPEDDRKLRVAVNAPIYFENDIPIEPEEDNNIDLRLFNSNDIEIISEKILLKDTRSYSVYLYNNEEKVMKDITVTANLLSTDNDVYYYKCEIEDGNHFSITSKKTYLKDKLEITCECEYQGIVYKKQFLFELGGYN